jgi:predicted nucleic-acid-binding protein
MIGLDTNVILRYLLQDDPRQTPLANHNRLLRAGTNHIPFVTLESGD